MFNRWIHLISIVLTLLVISFVLETIFLHGSLRTPLHVTFDEEELYQSTVFAGRRNHTLTICQGSYPTSRKASSVDLRHILLDEKRKLMFCVVPKVACTNWKRVLISLETGQAYSDIEYPHTHSFKSLSTLVATDGYTKFLFVRHPFERLVSAFENKIHKPFTKYFVSRLLREGMKNLSFPSFVNYILSKRPEDLNEHWAPQHSLCLPCEIKYDYIGKYESLQRDSAYVLQHILHSNITLPQIKSQSPIGRTAMLTPIYMRSLDKESRKKVFQLYKRDFELFGFPIPKEFQNNHH